MSVENEKIIAKGAKQLYGSQGEFCRKYGFSEYNFSALKKRSLKSLERITCNLGLEIVLRNKEEIQPPKVKVDEVSIVRNKAK